MQLLHSFRFLAQLLFLLPPFCFLSCPLFLIFLPLFFYFFFPSPLLNPVVFILFPTLDSFITSCPLFTQVCGLTMFWVQEGYLLWAKSLNSCLNKKQLLQNVSLVFCAHGSDWKKLREMNWKFSVLFHYLYLSKQARCRVLPPERIYLWSILSHS